MALPIDGNQETTFKIVYLLIGYQVQNKKLFCVLTKSFHLFLYKMRKHHHVCSVSSFHSFEVNYTEMDGELQILPFNKFIKLQSWAKEIEIK